MTSEWHPVWCTDHDSFSGAHQSDIVSVRDIDGGPAVNLQLGQAQDDTPRVSVDFPDRPMRLSVALGVAQALQDLSNLGVSTEIARAEIGEDKA
jgi:hypothetical protein